MPYVTSRIYAGKGSTSIQELNDIVQKELVPELAKAGGLFRYIALEFTDGRIGSFSAYQDKTSADRAQSIAARWASSTGVMHNYKLAASYDGDVLLTLSGKAELTPGAAGIIRIYDTAASEADIRAAFEEVAPKIEGFAGLIRLNVVKLSSGGLGTFSSYDTPESAAQVTQYARETRSKAGSLMQKVLPKDPETIETTLISIYNT
jgi:hypothetical protein